MWLVSNKGVSVRQLFGTKKAARKLFESKYEELQRFSIVNNLTWGEDAHTHKHTSHTKNFMAAVAFIKTKKYLSFCIEGATSYGGCPRQSSGAGRGNHPIILVAKGYRS